MCIMTSGDTLQQIFLDGHKVDLLIIVQKSIILENMSH